ncbi:hypothetical protein JMA_04390 [Jeotgalibacillus malaysiensis]|uniref:Uncharacterized protein n=1 Tax=Jeotgalibacillus malaysiensis TaxID=1508404 RepID=A0A0B5AI69_9BACL|nr:hypothetical protein JMA_04390 [Jeotgalibacillus malaysiensis]
MILGLLTGLFIVPMVIDWMGFSLAEFYNQTFNEHKLAGGITGATVIIIVTYFAGRSFIKEYRSIEE